MKTIYKELGIIGLILTGLVITGCLVSGTFVIVEDVDFSFTADNGFYWYPVDLTTNSDWEDHKDDIDNIDALGFSFKIENTSGVSSTFTVQFAAATGVANPLDEPTSIPDDVVTVITGLTVAAGATRTVTYAESLGMISNLAALKAIVKSGRFDYYGTSSGGSGDFPFEVTDGKIIVTVSASGS
ncbi:MAG: hypothetical protein NTW07_03710 [candidate division Zixibacteria bacterium]|nr:hypothetical protein [candidate division Zixibacteria bacterium]